MSEQKEKPLNETEARQLRAALVRAFSADVGNEEERATAFRLAARRAAARGITLLDLFPVFKKEPSSSYSPPPYSNPTPPAPDPRLVELEKENQKLRRKLIRQKEEHQARIDLYEKVFEEEKERLGKQIKALQENPTAFSFPHPKSSKLARFWADTCSLI